MRRALALGAWLLAVVVVPAWGQADSAVAHALAAYNDLDYASAIRRAREALGRPLSTADRITAYELLGYSYGALDSTRQAVDAFRRLIFLAPDREPDVERVSPRITSLYASALGQVLVVRRLHVDSAMFVAGQGAVPIRFEVSRTAQTVTKVIGAGLDAVIDSQTVGGTAQVLWSAREAGGRPVPPGEYEVVVIAREGARDEFASEPLRFRVGHAHVDTLPHLDSLPGYEEQPEMVAPPRDFRPLAVSVVVAGLTTAAFLALQNEDLGNAPQIGMITIAGLSLGTGAVLTLRKPDPRPSPTNILYNQLIRELLVRRNAEIARENATRREQVLVTVQAVR